MAAPLLTIAIPTFERDKTLKQCLAYLLPILKSHGRKIELLILDNASSDDTPGVINSFVRSLPPGLSVRSFRHESNIGMSENILSCVEQSVGKYFMFIGDDDTVNAEGLQTVLDLLENGHAPSAIIQGNWTNYGFSFPRTKTVDPHQTTDYFFFAGNAWATISRTAYLKEALKTFREDNSLIGNIWPQSFLIFHTIFSHPESPPLITSFPLGNMINAKWMVRPEKKYMVTIIEDLLDVGIALPIALQSVSQARQFFTGPTLAEFERLLRSLIRISIRDLNQASTWGIVWKLARNRIPVRPALQARLFLAGNPVILLVLTLAHLVLKGGPRLAQRFLQDRSAARAVYLAEVLSSPQSGLRVRSFH